MKTAQCTYRQAGVDISLHIYFDPKIFDLMTEKFSLEEEDDLMRLVVDSMAAALPRENMEKHFFIKRVFMFEQMLTILCTDGFLTDGALNLPVSRQAYSDERIKLSEIDQLPTRLKLSNDLLKRIHEKLPIFESEVKRIAPVISKTTVKAKAHQAAKPLAREYRTDKEFEVLTEISNAKKEIAALAANNIKSLDSLLAGEDENKLDSVAKEIRSALNGVPDAQFKEILLQKKADISPHANNFSAEADEIARQVTEKTEKLAAFRQLVINALYESAKQVRELVAGKYRDAPLHLKKTLSADFNNKFSGIASMTESGELSSFQETTFHLEKLSLEDLQKIISSDQKDSKGLLQKCNTSWTEESPELQIVMKQLTQLEKSLSSLFRQDPHYANQEMSQIIRIPFPRSFQFKFSESALDYKKVADDFCKTQKESLLTLANQYKKNLQITDIKDKAIHQDRAEAGNLKKYKEASDSMLTLASKDHAATKALKDEAEKMHARIEKSIDPGLTSLIEKMKEFIEQVRKDALDADNLMNELSEAKSQIDIKLSHFFLHPEETPDFTVIDEQLKRMTEKRKLLLSENSMLQDANKKLTAYDTMIKRITEFDLSATRSGILGKRKQAKEYLLQFMQQENIDPAKTEPFKKQVLEQYSLVDTNAFDIDKTLGELTDIQRTLLSDLESQPDPVHERFDTQFKQMAEKMQLLKTTIGVMDQNVEGLKKFLDKHN